MSEPQGKDSPGHGEESPTDKGMLGWWTPGTASPTAGSMVMVRKCATRAVAPATEPTGPLSPAALGWLQGAAQGLLFCARERDLGLREGGGEREDPYPLAAFHRGLTVGVFVSMKTRLEVSGSREPEPDVTGVF